MNHSLFLFVPQTLRQPAAAPARSVFVSEFSERAFARHARVSFNPRAGNLSGIAASISYQPNRPLRGARRVFTTRPSQARSDSQRIAFNDRSTRSGHNVSNVSLNRTSNMFAPALPEMSYLFRR